MSDLQWALLGLGVLVVIGVYVYTRMTRPSSYDYLKNIPPEEDEDAPPPPSRATAWDDDDDDLDWLSRPPADDVEDPFRFDPEPEPESEPEPEPVRERAPARTRSPEPSLARAGVRQDEPPTPPRRARPPAPEVPADAAEPAAPEVHMPAPPSGEEKLVVLHVAAPQGQRFGGDAVHSALRDCGLQFGSKQVYHRIKEVDDVAKSVFSVANMVKPGYLDPMERDRLRTPGLSLFMVLPGPEEPVPAYRDFEQTAERLAAELGGQVLDERRQLLTRQMSQFLQEEMADLERRQLAGRAPGAER